MLVLVLLMWQSLESVPLIFLKRVFLRYNSCNSEVRVEGLETLDYLDNLQNRERFTEQGDAITFEGEVRILGIFILSSICCLLPCLSSRIWNTILHRWIKYILALQQKLQSLIMKRKGHLWFVRMDFLMQVRWSITILCCPKRGDLFFLDGWGVKLILYYKWYFYKQGFFLIYFFYF